MTKTITVTETAKLVRHALKSAFPGIKFSVRSSSYAGGASIDIHYTDGPTEDAVNAVVCQFQGASFDGMIDLKSYHDTEYNGETVHFGADYVMVTRSYSVDFLTKACRFISQREGLPMPMIHVSEYNGTGYLNDNQYIAERNTYLNTLMWRGYKHFDAAIIDQLEAIGAIADWMNGLAWHVYSKLLPAIKIEDFDLGSLDKELPTDEEREEQRILAHQVMASMMGEEMATLFMEEGEEQSAYPLHMPQPPDDLHPTHGALPAWMYADEQEPYALSHAPMQQQHSAITRLCIDCHTTLALHSNERCEPCYERYLASFQNTLARTPLVARSQPRSEAQSVQTYHDTAATIFAPYAFSGRERELFDEAVQRGLALGRPFLEQEVLQQAWNEGYELMIGMDARFVLAGETATKPRLPLWLVKTEQ